MRTPADNGGRGVKNRQNLAGVFYGWPLYENVLNRVYISDVARVFATRNGP